MSILLIGMLCIGAVQILLIIHNLKQTKKPLAYICSKP